MSSELRTAEGGQLAAEDAARANLYALIGRLFYDAPDATLLAELCRLEAAPEDGEGPVVQAWHALREASKSASPDTLKPEYDTLFVGVGKSEVTPYTSHYIKGNSPDRHLVRLRERLEQLGLARRSAAFEVEDHVAGVCDVMRVLILDGHSLSEQSLFFKEFVYAGTAPFCVAVAGSASAVIYRHIAAFTGAFLEVERQVFEMHEAEV